jgi:hypothetical protein
MKNLIRVPAKVNRDALLVALFRAAKSRKIRARFQKISPTRFYLFASDASTRTLLGIHS